MRRSDSDAGDKYAWRPGRPDEAAPTRCSAANAAEAADRLDGHAIAYTRTVRPSASLASRSAPPEATHAMAECTDPRDRAAIAGVRPRASRAFGEPPLASSSSTSRGPRPLDIACTAACSGLSSPARALCPAAFGQSVGRSWGASAGRLPARMDGCHARPSLGQGVSMHRRAPHDEAEGPR